MYLLSQKDMTAAILSRIQRRQANGNGFFSYDVSFVKEVSGFNEDDEMINPFRFKTPVSPHLASEAEGFAVDKEIILDRYRSLVKSTGISWLKDAEGLRCLCPGPDICSFS